MGQTADRIDENQHKIIVFVSNNPGCDFANLAIFMRSNLGESNYLWFRALILLVERRLIHIRLVQSRGSGGSLPNTQLFLSHLVE